MGSLGSIDCTIVGGGVAVGGDDVMVVDGRRRNGTVGLKRQRLDDTAGGRDSSI